jgi:hypothetical protein
MDPLRIAFQLSPTLFANLGWDSLEEADGVGATVDR